MEIGTAASIPRQPEPIEDQKFRRAILPYMQLIRWDKVGGCACRRIYGQDTLLWKPTGTLLVFWPFAWGLTMAAYSTGLPFKSYIRLMTQCLFGAFIIRSSACTVNDIIDWRVDANVERTKGRPIPSGRVTIRAAATLLLVEWCIGVAFFYLTIDNDLAYYSSLFQLLPLFTIYPLLKRITHWPQAWLGFAMNFGFLTAWFMVTDAINTLLLVVGLIACWCWTMYYDTIYACQDVHDDAKLGVRSTAILFGQWICPLLSLFAIMFTVLLAIAGYLNCQGRAFYIVSVLGTAVHLFWQMTAVQLEEPVSCGWTFKQNGSMGTIVLVGLAIDYVDKVWLQYKPR